MINVTESITRGASFSGSGQLLIPYEVVEGNIKDGAVVVAYADPPEACMNMEFKFAFRIMFERGLISDTEDFAVGDFLYKIVDAVEAIILNFERFIEAYPRLASQAAALTNLPTCRDAF